MTCPRCGRDVPVRADGGLKVHHPEPPDPENCRRHCPASGLPIIINGGPQWSCCGSVGAFHPTWVDGRCGVRWHNEKVNVATGSYGPWLVPG